MLGTVVKILNVRLCCYRFTCNFAEFQTNCNCYGKYSKKLYQKIQKATIRQGMHIFVPNYPIFFEYISVLLNSSVRTHDVSQDEFHYSFTCDLIKRSETHGISDKI